MVFTSIVQPSQLCVMVKTKKITSHQFNADDFNSFHFNTVPFLRFKDNTFSQIALHLLQFQGSTKGCTMRGFVRQFIYWSVSSGQNGANLTKMLTSMLLDVLD